ncbi:hypothetical protein OIV83_000837 [Microbotryomycetes sp. JL201]|nr:hypothetical protein OIV83_000837 [Microbotryomycetes sp. JL201]
MLIYKRSASPQLRDYDALVTGGDDDDDLDMLPSHYNKTGAIHDQHRSISKQDERWSWRRALRRVHGDTQEGERISRNDTRKQAAIERLARSPDAVIVTKNTRTNEWHKSGEATAQAADSSKGKNCETGTRSSSRSMTEEARRQAADTLQQPAVKSLERQRNRKSGADPDSEDRESALKPTKHVTAGQDSRTEQRTASPPRAQRQPPPLDQGRRRRDSPVQSLTVPTNLEGSDLEPHVPTLAEFIASLPIPLGHLVPAFTTLGLSTPTDLVALASDTEAGRNARQIILDQVDQLSEPGLTVWQRVVLEEQLKSRGRTWTPTENEQVRSTPSSVRARARPLARPEGKDWLDALAAPPLQDYRFSL